MIAPVQLDNDGLGKAGYQFLLGAAFGEKPNPSRVPEFKGAFEEKLQALETQLGKYPGPFIMGEVCPHAAAETHVFHCHPNSASLLSAEVKCSRPCTSDVRYHLAPNLRSFVCLAAG